jgi:hypothetical protein
MLERPLSPRRAVRRVGRVVGVKARRLIVAWPIHSWIIRRGAPAAAMRVPKVCRRSWKRIGRSVARATAAVNRFLSLTGRRHRPSAGGRRRVRRRPGTPTPGSGAPARRRRGRPWGRRGSTAGSWESRTAPSSSCAGHESARWPVHVPPPERAARRAIGRSSRPPGRGLAPSAQGCRRARLARSASSSA